MKIYTYYEDLNCGYQNKLLNLWKKSWENHGFEAIILTRKNVELHPFYIKYVDSVQSIHEHIANRPLNKYGMACWLRWLAYATLPEEKFYVSDYDVINHHFNPIEPSDFLCLLDGECPCIASGTSSQFYDLCQKFTDISQTCTEEFVRLYKEFNFIQYHDQEFCQIINKVYPNLIKMTRDRETFLSTPIMYEFWKKPLVHYGGALCDRYLQRLSKKFTPQARIKLIEESLSKSYESVHIF